MTYGPPSEPNASAPQSDAPAPGANVASSPPTPPHPHPQQPWTNPGGPGWPGGPPPMGPPKGFGLAVAAVILGLLGCVLPFLPMDMTGVRPYVAFPFALPGLALAVVGCIGRRRGKPLAVVGAILSVLALVVGVIMVAGPGEDDSSGKSESEERTRQVLQEDLNVVFGDVKGDTAANQNMTVMLYNKGRDLATFNITLELTHHRTNSVCETTMGATNLKPGDTYEQTIYSCFDDEPKPLIETGVKVVQASKSNFEGVN